MVNSKKNFYIIAGPNGAGKTTLSKVLLKDVFKCQNFVNADEIAKGIAPAQTQTQKYDILAAKMMLDQIDSHIKNSEDFCVETTLASKSYLQKIKKLKAIGYKISLFFIYLPNENFAIKRVEQRVSGGGHNIELSTIKRRYKKGLENLMNEYFDRVDELYIYGNHDGLKNIAQKVDGILSINDEGVFAKIKKYQNGN